MKKIKLKKKPVIILLITIILLIVLIVLISNLLKEKEDLNLYPVIDSYKLDYSIIGNSKDGMILVSDGTKLGFVNYQGELVVDMKYDYATNSYAEYVKDYVVIIDKNKKILLDKKGNEVLTDQNEMYIVDLDNSYYIVATKDKTRIYNSKLNQIFESSRINNVYVSNSVITEYYDNYQIIYDLDGNKLLEGNYINSNSNYVIVSKKQKYAIYYTKTKKLTDYIYDDYSFNEKEILLKQNNKYSLYNSEGLKIKDLNSDFKEATLYESNLLIVSDKCEPSEENDFLEGYIYDIDENLILDKCSYISDNFENKFILTNDTKNLYFNNNKLVKTIDSTTSMIVKDYFSAYFYEDGESYTNIYDKDGIEVLKNIESVFEYNNYYILTRLNGLSYILDSNLKNIDDKYYSSLEAFKDKIIYKDTSGLYGLLDKKFNKITEPIYNECNGNDDIAICKNRDNYELIVVSYKTKTEIENYEPHSVLKEEDKTIDVDSVIETYELNDIKDIIESDKNYFIQYASATIGNDALGNYKKNVLKLFKVVSLMKDYLDRDNLITNVKKLRINYYEIKPSDMTSYAVGEYYDGELKISLIDSSDRVIYHELMHFLQFNRGRKNNTVNSNIYKCNDKYISYQDMLKIDNLNCRQYYTGYFSSFEEASAEENTVEYFTDGIQEVYFKQVNIYEVLEYILGTPALNEMSFSSTRAYKLFSLFNKNLNWTPKQFNAFVDNMNMITNVDINYTADGATSYALYKIADDLVDLYKSVKGEDPFNDPIMKMALRKILHENIDSYAVRTNLKDYLNENNLTIKYLDNYSIDKLQIIDVDSKYTAYDTQIVIGTTNKLFKNSNAIIYSVYDENYEYGKYYYYYENNKLKEKEYKKS